MRPRTICILAVIWLVFGAYLFYSTVEQAKNGTLPHAWNLTADDAPEEDSEDTDSSMFKF